MREIKISLECLNFFDSQDERVRLKFFQLIKVISDIELVNSKFVKKLKSTPFYEIRLSAGNEFRIIICALDHLNFAECRIAICLYGFQKKSTKDYKKALSRSEKELKRYLERNKDESI